MSDLVTLAEYKALTGTTGTGDDALLAVLITAASAAVESWCGRTFSLRRIWHWVRQSGTGFVTPLDWPVVRLLGQFEPLSDAVTLACASDAEVGYQASVRDGVLTVVSDLMDDVWERDLSDYDTLDEVLDDSSSGFEDLTWTLSDAALRHPMSLQPGSVSVPVGGAAWLTGAERLASSLSMRSEDLVVRPGCSLLVYDAGYAAIPGDLQRSVSQVVRDALAVSKDLTGAGEHVRSFSITNYSETLADGQSWADLVGSRAAELAPYRRIVV